MRHLRPDVMDNLIKEVIPESWYRTGVIEETCEVDGDWLEHVWVYLRRHHPNDLSLFLDLPLLQLDDDTVVPLTLPSQVVLRSQFGVELSPGMRRCLEVAGVTVVDKLVDHVHCHAAVVGSFVRLPRPEDVVDVLLTASHKNDVVTALLDNTMDEEKLELLTLTGKLNRDGIDVKHRTFLRTLPIFKSTHSTPEQPQFVSSSEVNAAHSSRCTVTLMEAFIDVSTKEAMSAATNLEVNILNEVDFVKDHILSEMRNRSMNPGDVQKCMHYVFENIQMLQCDDPHIMQHFTDIPFVTTEGGEFQTPCRVYDPTDGTLQKLFLGEDNHFPSGFYESPESLVILRNIGMKTIKDVSANDILYTSIQIDKSKTCSEDSRQKAETLLMFLISNYDLLKEEVNGKQLVDWLRHLAWVPTCNGMPHGLKLGAADELHRAVDMKSYDWASIVGSVVPIVRCRSSKNISRLFGWDTPPSLFNAVAQFTRLTETYSFDATTDYLALVRDTYSFMSTHPVSAVQDALTAAGLREWVWHGEGFTTVERALLQPPALLLKPYVYTIPAGLKKFHPLLSGCGVRQLCTNDVLVDVLHDMKAKYDGNDTEQVNGASDLEMNVAQATTRVAPRQKHTAQEIDSDLRLAIDILNHMKSVQLSTSVLDRVLVPTDTDAEDTVCLLPASDCTYCDVEWLRKGFDSRESDGIVQIHDHLPTSTAAALGVATLMSRMLHAEELAITSFGQGETLTNTLRRMLEDYTDGLAIPKELVQNADDAGATEVRFMYDERTNGNTREYLFDKAMQECQGPALWCYSNSLFTDEDLANIIRLGGASKQLDPTKIGRYGLGFNVVYNLTDVPSFVTGNVVVFFDPHTTHLGRSIRDKSKPGIKLDLRHNNMLLRKLSHQFQPYRGVFGCDMDAASETSWPGTLFRFPLRTKLQAQRSEISGLHYDKARVSQLLTLLADNAQSLLLFTQNVKKVSLWHLSPDSSPEKAVNIFSVSVETVTTIRDIYPREITSDQTDCDTFLKAAVRHMHKGSAAAKGPQSSTVVRVKSYLKRRTSLLQTRPTSKNKYWLRCMCMDEGRAFELALQMKTEGYVPAVAVAIRVMPADSGYVAGTPVEDDRDGGQVFTCLPLPVRSGLPVHVNAMFALHSSRRRLVEKSADDTGNKLNAWNEALMEGGVVMAYTHMLEDLLSLKPRTGQDVHFYNTWPTVEDTDPHFQRVVTRFYRHITTHADTTTVFYSVENATVVTLDRVVFLDPELVESVQLVASVFRQCNSERTPVNVGDAVLESFREAGCVEFVDANTYDVKRFFGEIFFPNIHLLDASERDALVRFALLSKKVDSLLAQYPCVPVTPDGTVLRSPQDLVHPEGSVATLYLPTDGRFPYSDMFTDETCLRRLERLGMGRDDITWDNLVERLESVGNVYQEDTAMGEERIRCALEFLARKLMHCSEVFSKTDSGEELKQMARAAQKRIVQIPFLPLLPRPTNFPVAWKNEEYCPTMLLPPNVLYSHEQHYLVSAMHPIADDRHMKKEVREFLGLVRKKPSLDDVLGQIDHMLDMQPSDLGDADYNVFHSALLRNYAFLQGKSNVTGVSNSRSSDDVRIQSALHSRPCILVQRRFVPPQKVTLSQGSADCEPYLYSLSREMVRCCKPLMMLLGVRDHFEIADYMGAIQELKKHTGDEGLTQPELKLAITLASHILHCIELKQCKPDDVQEEHGLIYLPNKQGVLHPVNALCYDDNPPPVGNVATKQETDETHAAGGYTHPSVSRTVAMGLGVRTMEREILSRFAQGIPFGQTQDLTTSLRRILGSYPLSHEILKELVQNADDAGATEIHFVSDSRHHRDAAIFAPSWKPLQGPALCVYNNRSFTDDDLVGIQKLGEGTKLLDSSKTGQYGIGFSAMYHLTDTPSILTRPSGNRLLLSVFDPHLTYVPDASIVKPGMQYDVEHLQHRYPDVFSCYLPQCFDANNATLFRFPLRTKDMAEKSKISKRYVTPEKLLELLDELKGEACETLLFTNHLKKISISEVDHITGKLKNTYTAQAKLSNHHAMLKSDLACVSKGIVLADNGLPRNTFREIVSTPVITDTDGVHEKWCVSEQLGVDPNATVPESVTSAIRSGELCLLPRGGVACRIESNHVRDIVECQQERHVFCFLPLPIKTSLPVHINGHFALGYENRRRLWDNADRTSYKTDWNKLLCREVIAPCYVRLLTAIRSEFIPALVDESNCMELECSRVKLDKAISAYQTHLPLFDDNQKDWHVLVEAVYKTCAITYSPVFPSVRHQQGTYTWFVTWLPVTGKGKPVFTERQKLQEDVHVAGNKTYARTLQDKLRRDGILHDVLTTCGMTLVKASSVLIDSLERASIPVDMLSPKNAMSLFTSYHSDSPSCRLGQLPRPLSESPFRSSETMQIVLNYCKQDATFVAQLDGAPLLLTADNVVRVFDSAKPVYRSEYASLVPHSKHLFLHESMRLGVFHGVSTRAISSFTVNGLANLLEKELPSDRMHKTGRCVKWPRNDSTLPQDPWLRKLWGFIRSQVEKSAGNLPTSRLVIEDCLSPLNEWCLVPASVSTKRYSPTRAGTMRYLVPVRMAYTVFYDADFRLAGIPKMLRQLRVPELELLLPPVTSATMGHYPGTSTGRSNADVLKLLVATGNDPQFILGAVHKQMHEWGNTDALSLSDRRQLLAYFSANLPCLRGCDTNYVDRLRELSLYTTVNGDVIHLVGSCVYVLPCGVPNVGMDAWRRKSGIVFLSHDDSLTDLYAAIGCKFLTLGDIYCKFILQQLEYLSREEIMTHLHYVYGKFMKLPHSNDKDVSPEDRTNVVSMLRTLPILQVEPGADLRPASDFYDPDNEVFQVMLTADKFPPRPDRSPFTRSEWRDFLSRIGLQLKVTPSAFVEFVQLVATEGRKDSKSASAKRKSRVLVKHLFAVDVLEKPWWTMQSIADVAFLPEMLVDQSLQQLHPQRAPNGRYIAFRGSIQMKNVDIVWTQAQLLPDWADPGRRNFSTAVKAKQCLGIADSPPIQMVAMHLRTLCEDDESGGDNVVKQKVVRSIYGHLQDHGLQDQDKRDILSNTPCVLIEDGSFVFAKQTVVDMYDTDEIRPYLYKVPLNLGEFEALFQVLGATKRTTTDQYSSVLINLHMRTAHNELDPNELLCAMKAMSGLFRVLKEGGQSPSVPILFLLSEARTLVRSTMLVFNDAPSYYERAGVLPDLQFMARVQECGDLRLEDSLRRLDTALQPVMLSSVVNERLVQECKLCNSMNSVAARLSVRLQSPVFLSAISRLAHHEAYLRGFEADKATIDDATNRLSTINVLGIIGNVITELVYKQKALVDSRLSKTCFVEKPLQLGHVAQWHVYVSSDAEQNLDLFVSLAEVINEIMSSLLKDAILYLLPIISCQSEDDINVTLNKLNVREHHPMAASGRSGMVPLPGDQVSDTHQKLFKAGQEDFTVGEYVGYRPDDSPLVLYSIIKERLCSSSKRLRSSSNEVTYVIHTGENKATTVAVSQLYKFVRN